MSNNTNIRERIREYIDFKGVSVSLFYQQSNLKRGILDKDKMNKDIGAEKITHILVAYPDLNSTWLLTGVGQMTKDTKKTPLNVLSKPSTGYDKRIPLIPIEAVAGYGDGDFSIELAQLDSYVVPELRDADFLIRIKGDSMYPTYKSGDIVGCRRIFDSSFIQPHKVYVFDTTQGVIIKRLDYSDIEGRIVVISDNKKYGNFELDFNELRSLSIVVGTIRLE